MYPEGLLLALLRRKRLVFLSTQGCVETRRSARSDDPLRLCPGGQRCGPQHSDPGQERLRAGNTDLLLHVVGQHIQGHLSRGGLQPLREEVHGSHQAFERAEDMLNRAFAYLHGIRTPPEPRGQSMQVAVEIDLEQDGRLVAGPSRGGRLAR
jgi:hypothetical protein